MNEKIMEQAGFSEEVNNVKAGKCPFCKKMVDLSEFRDELSKKEFLISGICQRCQDKFFGGNDE